MDNTLTRIAARVADTPQATALRTAQGTHSYLDLWRDAGRIAAALRAAELGPGDLVAIQLPSGPSAIAAMLGVWQVGAAFLPIDMATPTERRDFLLRHSRTSVLIADNARLAQTAGCDVRVVVPGECAEATEEAGIPDVAEVARVAEAARAAYVIYTSGSTGTPKGVLIGHDALHGHVNAAIELFELTRDDTVLQFASIGFDVAQEEIWPTLAAGGTLAFQSGFHTAGVLDATLLSELSASLDVTVLQLPTAYWRMLCAELQTRPDVAFPQVRLVVVGGENATVRDAEAHRQSALSGAVLVNGYGPTETVITATAHRITPHTDVDSLTGSLPIGRAMGARNLYVLDEDLRPVRTGEPGELWIGGPLLAIGYLHDDERTAERFLSDPFIGIPAARMYRTGDLVRERPDGALEFLGRADNQVKVRGYRIELDEVDRHLRDVDGVLEAISFTLDAPGGPGAGVMLAAAIRVSSGGPTAAAVRQLMSSALPGYLVPSHVCVMDELPLTTSGKIDRKAAAAATAAQLAASRHAEAGTAADPNASDDLTSADPVSVLTALVARTLQAPGIGPDDDFFLLGGDSLIAMRVTAQAHQAGIALRPIDLLQGRTPREAARRATERAAHQAPTLGGKTSGPVGLLPAQHRWLRDGTLPDPDHFCLNALFTVPPGLSAEKVRQAANRLVARHSVLRTALRDDTAEIRPDLDHEVVTVHRLTDVPQAERTERVEALLAAAQRTMSLAAGRVFAVQYLDLGDEPGRLLLTVHHFVLDGVSMGLLVDDLEKELEVALAHRDATTGPVGTSVHDLDAALSRWLTSDQARRDCAQWLALAGERAALRPTRQDGPGLLPTLRTHIFRLPAALTRIVLHELPEVGLQPNDFTLGCLVGGLAQWTGDPVQGVDVYAHSRDVSVGDLDVSATVGYLQSTFPAVLRRHGDGLTALRRSLAALDRLPERRYGFDALRFASPLVEERAALEALPRPQVRLNFRGHLLRMERRQPDSLLSPAPESFGAHRSPRQTERYLLMAEGDVVDERLEIGLRYSTDHWSPRDIAELARAIEECMRLALSALREAGTQPAPTTLRPSTTPDSPSIAATPVPIGALA